MGCALWLALDINERPYIIPLSDSENEPYEKSLCVCLFVSISVCLSVSPPPPTLLDPGYPEYHHGNKVWTSRSGSPSVQ